MINTWFKDFYVKVTYAASIDDCSQIKASHSPKPEETTGEKNGRYIFLLRIAFTSLMDKFVKPGVWNQTYILHKRTMPKIFFYSFSFSILAKMKDPIAFPSFWVICTSLPQR